MPSCSVQKGTHAGELTKWTLIRGDARKTGWVCARHGKAIDTLWDALTPLQKPRRPLRVLGSPDDIPRV